MLMCAQQEWIFRYIIGLFRMLRNYFIPTFWYLWTCQDKNIIEGGSRYGSKIFTIYQMMSDKRNLRQTRTHPNREIGKKGWPLWRPNLHSSPQTYGWYHIIYLFYMKNFFSSPLNVNFQNPDIQRRRAWNMGEHLKLLR